MAENLKELLAIATAKSDEVEGIIQRFVARTPREDLAVLMMEYYDMAESKDPALRLTGTLCLESLIRACRAVLQRKMAGGT